MSIPVRRPDDGLAFVTLDEKAERLAKTINAQGFGFALEALPTGDVTLTLAKAPDRPIDRWTGHPDGLEAGLRDMIQRQF